MILSLQKEKYFNKNNLTIYTELFEVFKPTIMLIKTLY